MKKVFITILVGSLRRGGAETQLNQILPALDKKKFQIEIFLLSTRGELACELESAGISVIDPWFDTGGRRLNIFNRIYRYFVMVLQLYIYFIKRKPDIVHFFLPQSYCFSMPIAILAQVKKKVMSRLSLNNYRKNRMWMWQLEKYLHGFTDKIIVNAECIKEQLINEERVKESKICRIYSGVDFSDISTKNKESLRKKLNIGADDLVLIMVANLIPYKGHVDAINALGKISSKMPNQWKILFIGRDDGIKDDLVHLTKINNIYESCCFLHPHGSVLEYYDIADIAMLTSHEEGFSIAILEAMRSGLPMVVTDVGGNSEAVKDFETGIVVPAQEPDKLAEAILSLSFNEGKRITMGNAGRRKVREEFTIDKCVKLHEDLYVNLMFNADASISR